MSPTLTRPNVARPSVYFVAWPILTSHKALLSIYQGVGELNHLFSGAFTKDKFLNMTVIPPFGVFVHKSRPTPGGQKTTCGSLLVLPSIMWGLGTELSLGAISPARREQQSS